MLIWKKKFFRQLTFFFFLFLFPLHSLLHSQTFSDGVGKEQVTNPSDSVSSAETNSFYQDPTKSGEDSISYGYLLLRTILVLVLFIVFAYFILRFLKSRQALRTQENPFIKIITEFPLSINKQIKIIRVVNDFYVLSVTQDQIRLIDKVSDKEAIDRFKLEEGNTVPAATFFSDIFSRYTDMKKTSPLGITQNLKKRLTKM